MYSIQVIGKIDIVDEDAKAYKIISAIPNGDKMMEVPSIVYHPYWYKWLPSVGDLVIIRGVSNVVYEDEKFTIKQEGDLVKAGMTLKADFASIIASNVPDPIGSVLVNGCGWIGKPKPLKYVASGKAVKNFRIGCTISGSKKKEKETKREEIPLWMNCAIWGNFAEAMDLILDKKGLVAFHGTVRFNEDGMLRTYMRTDDKTKEQTLVTSFDVNVGNLMLAGSGGGGHKEEETNIPF